jgi:hypothetical protein
MKYDNWYVENNKQLKWAKRKINHGFTRIDTDIEGGGRKTEDGGNIQYPTPNIELRSKKIVGKRFVDLV